MERKQESEEQYLEKTIGAPEQEEQDVEAAGTEAQVEQPRGGQASCSLPLPPSRPPTGSPARF